MSAVPTKRLFRLEEYDRLGRLGAFDPTERLELIEGEIVAMSPIGPRHMRVLNRLAREFARLAVAGEADLSIQNPVSLPPDSRPQPDLALLRVDEEGKARFPGPEDVYLIVEVSDTTVEFDRGTKLPLYARAGIPEVWIVDIPRECVETYRRPAEGRYEELQTHHVGATIACVAFPEAKVGLAELLS